MRRSQRFWRSVFAGLPHSEEVYESVLELYCDPRRSYHTIGHVLACLDLLAANRETRAGGDIERPFILEAALWFHDVVYEPGASDNEERSAELAFRSCRRMAVSISDSRAVSELVLATAHFDVPPSECAGPAASRSPSSIIRDIDLSILGSAPAEFRRYEWAVRREYAFRNGSDYRTGRGRVCAHFLSRDRIYLLDWFHTRFEKRARANLGSCLRRLEVQEDGTSA